MKKFFVLMLSFLLAIAFSACGSSNTTKPAQTDALTSALPASSPSNGGLNAVGSRTARVLGQTLNDALNPYCIEYKLTMDGTELTIVQGVKDGKVYSEFEYQDSILKTLAMDGYNYNIYDADKIVIKSKMPQSKVPNFENHYDALKSNFTSGSDEINGMTYEYEEMVTDGYVTRLYYEGDALRYIRAGDILMEIVSYNNEPDEKWFELPQGYFVMEA